MEEGKPKKRGRERRIRGEYKERNGGGGKDIENREGEVEGGIQRKKMGRGKNKEKREIEVEEGKTK